MYKFFYSTVILFLAGCFLTVPNVLAQQTVLDDTSGASYASCGDCKDLTIAGCKQYCGAYELNDGMALVKKVSDIILAVVGSLALLAFVIGGLMFVMSGGNQAMVTRGKATIVGAVIGLFIVFFSYTVISYISKDILQVPDDVFTAGTNK